VRPPVEPFEELVVRLPRMTTRRWMVAVVLVAVVMWAEMRRQRLRHRAAFHAGEKRVCLVVAQRSEKLYALRKVLMQTGAISQSIWLATREELEEALELRDRAAYHARLELACRWAMDRPWAFVPAETPFVPDDHQRSASWLLDKSQRYTELEQEHRLLARAMKTKGYPQQAEEEIRLADQDAKRASDYLRRAKLRQEAPAPASPPL
jgi:hypothetical protein